MIAIYKREVMSYFRSMLGYFLIAFFLLLEGLFASIFNFKGGYSNFEYILNSMVFSLIPVVPLITMRIFSDERRLKTDQLLLTSPVSIAGIVIGKYLAAMSLIIIPVLVSCAYPLVYCLYGKVNFGISYGAILCFFVLSGSLVAIGMYISTLIDNPILAAVTSFGIFLVCYMMTYIIKTVSSSAVAAFLAFTVASVVIVLLVYVITKSKLISFISGLICEGALNILYLVSPSTLKDTFFAVLNCFAVFKKFTVFVYGIFDLTVLAYYMSIIALFITLSIFSVEKRRWS